MFKWLLMKVLEKLEAVVSYVYIIDTIILILILMLLDIGHIVIYLVILGAAIAWFVWDRKTTRKLFNGYWHGNSIPIAYKEEVTLDPKPFHSPNQFQSYENMVLTASDGKLCLLVPYCLDRPYKTYCDKLCIVEKGSLRPIIKIDHVLRVGQDQILFNASVSTREGRVQTFVHRYTISSKTEEILVIDGKLRDIWNLSESCLVAAVEDAEDRYVLLCDGQNIKADHQSRGYSIGGKTYCLEHTENFLEKELACYDERGNRTVLPSWGGNLNVVPCEQGLLIHNYDGDGGILSLLDEETGDTRLLFQADILGKSTVNFWRNTAFLAWKSWEGAHELDGLWRIDLTDGTKEKISNSVYCGLYIFDDSGIFACAEEGRDILLYKLDFDGNVLFQILN